LEGAAQRIQLSDVVVRPNSQSFTFPPRVSGVISKLDELIEEFAELEPRERLELLVEFSDDLPALPARLQVERQAGCNRVDECQTEVHLWVERENGCLQVHADVAPEAPTVKGFVALLVGVCSGESPEAVLDVPPDLVRRLGLIEALGMVRMRGLSGILARIREGARRCAASEA
jgi:cysteine desulfuration protein SufE